MRNAVDIIRKKRDGEPLGREEIRSFITGYVSGCIPDYQASALAMAVYFRGMSEEETAELTMAMVESGETLDLSSIPGIKVDKHSTGGVGDKTTLTVAPIVAAAGVPIAKMSGRGLGHTGGTIDKLESIPGFQVELTRETFLRQVADIGLAVVAQSGDLVPADKKLYALRDVTATVDSIPLIAASVMSKKLAAGADAILLDVKVGDGAFMKDIKEALELARRMVAIGQHAGRRVVAVLSDMDQPLGQAIGNALEVSEAIEVLKGQGPEDLRRLTVFLAGHLIWLGGRVSSPEHGEQVAREMISGGLGLDKFRQMVRAQGGKWPEGMELPLPVARLRAEVTSENGGYLSRIRTEDLGRCANLLGAGRERMGEDIDHSAGIVILKRPGDRVEKGDALAILYANDAGRMESARERVRDTFLIGDTPPESRPFILGVVTAEGEQVYV